MNLFSHYLPVARDVMCEVWTAEGTKPAQNANRWLLGDEGFAAFVRLVDRLHAARNLSATSLRKRLPVEIFRLEVEIAARRSGVCPELEAVPLDRLVNTDC